MKKRVISMLLLTAMLLSLAACNTEETDVQGNGTENGEGEKEITVLLASAPASLDYYYTSGWGEEAHYNLLFDYLVYKTDDVQYLPSVAESWELVDDGTNCNWIFNIRDDVYFHDGEQLTAEDVQFSLMRPLDEEAMCTGDSLFTASGSMIDNVEIIDDFTVQIHTSAPNADFLGWVCRYKMEPKHYYAEQPSDVTSLNPIGSGPFKLEEFSVNEYCIMTRNEDYWGWDEEYNQINADKVTFRYVPEASTRVAEFSAGNADIIEKITLSMKEQVETAGNFVQITSGTRETIGITTYNNPALQDERVRQALNYAVDVETMIDTIFDGFGERMTSPIVAPNGNKVEPYTYDPDRARELLSEAGWEDRDGNGVLENEAGEELRLTMVTTDGYATEDKDIAESVCYYLGEIGIPTELETADWSVYSGWRGELNFPYDMFLTTNGPMYFPTGDLAIFYSDNGANYYHWNDPEFDQLWDELSSEFDEERAEELEVEIEQKVVDGAPMIYIVFSPIYFGISDDVEWQPWTNTGVYLRNAVVK